MKQYLENFWSMQGDAFRLSLATSFGCVASAGALALCSTSAPTLHSSQGIALVGAFYFLIALCGARWRVSSLAIQPIPWSLPSRTALPPRADAFRAARGGWDQN